MSNKTKARLYFFIKNDGLVITTAGVIFIAVCTKMLLLGKDDLELIDWTIFFSIIATFLLEWSTGILKKFLLNKLEDNAKLETDYNNIFSKYCDVNFIEYDNGNATPTNIEVLKKATKKVGIIKFPVVCEQKLQGTHIIIEDSSDMYELPKIIRNHFEDILAAHDTSHVYNQLNIRVTGWQMDENSVFRINTARTTYFYSLVTNRAMDFKWNGLTVRELLEYGPFLHSLAESKLSNHLGFNGFVESSDGYIAFVKRSKDLSIGKSTYGNSVGASMKVKYALDEARHFTKQGIVNAMLNEIFDELKIPPTALEEFSCEKNIISAYRDLVEGGKPQLLFYAKSKWNKIQITDNFKRQLKIKKNSAKEVELLEDGTFILWIPKQRLKEMALAPELIVYEEKGYKMMPSASAAVVMLIDYLQEKGEL